MKYNSIEPGNNYGNWFVLRYSDTTKKRVICKCACGTIKEVDKHSIKRGDSKSCGCEQNKIINLVGSKFDRLTVVKQHIRRNPSNKVMWVCKCDCGETVAITGNGLMSGTTRSCGCLKIEAITKLGKKYSLTRGKASFNSLYRKYKEGAKKRNLEFTLTEEEFEELTKSKCFYCDALPKQRSHTKSYKGAYIYNGIDRVNNKVGYVEENCVPCCGTCNRLKGTMELPEFINKLMNIYKNIMGMV